MATATIQNYEIVINGTRSEIDQDIHLGEMQDARPQFFRNTHGKRETFSVHRGFLIVRNTNTFGGDTYRSTHIYAAVVSAGPYEGAIRKINLVSVCGLPQGEEIRDSKKRIDGIIEAGSVATY